jgi:hypothetical protein
MIINLWVRNKINGNIHQVGTDQHDSLELIDGKVEFINLQCMCGTLGGDYEFVKSPDLDEYVSVTPEQLYLNRELIHKDLLKQLEESELFKDGEND